MVRVRWTDIAVKNLADIGDYIGKDSIKYAKIVVKNLFVSTNILKRHPRIGRMIPEFNNPTIRELIRGNYRIVYWLIDEKHIDIITIHHGARLFENNPALRDIQQEEWYL
jgi:addiction module RelE/StbE family toxin